MKWSLISSWRDFRLIEIEAKLPYKKNKDKILLDFYRIAIAIVDGFVNSNLTEFNNFYEYFIDKFNEILNIRYVNNPQHSLAFYLMLYIFNFIHFKAVLRNKEKWNLETKVQLSLSSLANLCNAKTFRLNRTIRFNELNVKLSKFNEMKDTKDTKVILKYIFEIIKILDFWNEEKIIEQINYIVNTSFNIAYFNSP